MLKSYPEPQGKNFKSSDADPVHFGQDPDPTGTSDFVSG